MAVTKRTRFEVLRRDEHTCQYCGAKAPDVTLQIDHVMPVALGGDDKPGNLVTACKDCNSGKASIPPDAPIVAGLSERAAAYALGMVDKMTRFRADVERLEEWVDEFDDLWGRWHMTGEPGVKVPLPPDYELSLWRWVQVGVPRTVFELAIRKAMSKPGIRGEHGVFQYMAGIINRMLDERDIDFSVTDETAAVYTQQERDEYGIDSYWQGRKAMTNELSADGDLPGQDFVHAHIDGWSNAWMDQYREGGTPPWVVTEAISA